MNAPHPLDPSRLERLRGECETARGAATRAHESFLRVHEKIGLLQAEIRKLSDDASAGVINLGRRELAETKKAADDEIAKLKAEKERLHAVSEEARERSNSLGALYVRCAEFAGVNPYDR